MSTFTLPNATDSPNGFLNPALYSNCTVQTCPIITSYYNYRINWVPNLIFIVLFAVCLPHFTVVYYFTRRGVIFWLAMQAGIIAEIIGYVGRLLGYHNQWDINGFLIQLICLAIGPTFFSAAIYVCLGRVVAVYGAENSRIPPQWYTRIFIPCDIIALILQAVGAIIASIALTENKNLATGDNIIIAGLAWQVFTLFVFLCFCVDFGLRVIRRRKALGDDVSLTQDRRMVRVRESWRLMAFLIVLGTSAVLVFWRCIYRLVELNSGFFGPVTFLQNLFIAFEGVLMLVLVFLLTVFHPALCLGEAMGNLKSDKVSKDGEAIGTGNLMQARGPNSQSGDADEERGKTEGTQRGS